MATLPENSVDAIVTDPPYGLGFMGQSWDSHDTAAASNGLMAGATGRAHSHGLAYNDPRKFQAWSESWAREAYRVLKPGGHMFAFGGTRTVHRLTCAIEDAGFEIRDKCLWLTGQGFPKSHNLHGEWDGWGTALKPAHEDVVLARKPLIGTVAANVSEHGTGALNIDGCRIEGAESWAGDDRPSDTPNGFGPGDADGWEGNWTKRSQSHALGRWPANVLLDEDAAALLDAQSGERKSAYPGNEGAAQRYHGSEVPLNGVTYPIGRKAGLSRSDTGGASRFFYCAKASRAERNAGLEGMPERIEGAAVQGFKDGSLHKINATRKDQGPSDRQPNSNHHPTVKPIAVMRWLCRLITPPGGTVLDPFLGSGTTGIAAVLEGFDFIGVEQDSEYLTIAERRIAHWTREAEKDVSLGPLFELAAD